MSVTPRNRFTGGLSENAGMTLLEMLGYIFVLAIVVNICLQVFLSSSRLATVGGSAVDRIENLAALQNDFRTSVRECVGVAGDVAGFASNENQAVLRTPDGERYVVFGALEGQQRLSKRTIRVKEGAGDLERVETYPVDLSAVRFTYSGEKPDTSRCVTLHVTAAGRVKDNRAGKDVTVAATVRGESSARQGQPS